MRHHALAQLQNLICMTLTTSDMRYAQITRIHEPHKLRTLVIHQRVRTNRIRRRWPQSRILRRNVRPLLGENIRVSTMAIRTPNVHRVRSMHRPNVAMAMNTRLPLAQRILTTLPKHVDIA